jgi:lipopolysaccharide transport system ATP-binding protein
VVDKNETKIFTSEIMIDSLINRSGLHDLEVKLPSNLLVPNKFALTFAIHRPNVVLIDYLVNCLSFEIVETGSDFHIYQGVDYGCVFINCDWTYSN